MKGRWDCQFYSPRYYYLEAKIRASGYSVFNLGDNFISSNIVDGPFGSDLKVDEYADDGIPLIRVSNCRTGRIVNDNELVYITSEKHQELIRSEVLPGDVLLTKAGHILGYTAVFPSDLKRGNITSHLARIRPTANILPDYLAAYLSSKIGVAQIYRWGNKATRPELNTDEVRQILVPVPPIEIQNKLVIDLEAARESRQKKIKQAEELLGSLDAWLLEKVGIKTQTTDIRKVFALRVKQIDGAMNAERYAKLPLQKLVSGITVGAVCEILKDKITPANIAPDEEWDRIRIDDLSNQPLQLDKIETSLGRNINGSFFLVQENDILLARLGPTIQNAKFVLCPPLKRQTIASSEFLVLRCQKGWNPEVVLWILRTKLFREIMYSKCTGGTPSRYRLSAESLEKISFSKVNTKTQRVIASEIRQRLNKIKRLRSEAEAEWAAAKARFEEQLLG